MLCLQSRASRRFFAVLVVSLLAVGVSNRVGASDSVKLLFTGDVMFHNTQLRRAWLGMQDGRDAGYAFDSAFDWVRSRLKAPDLTVGNLETTFGGPGSALVTDERYAFREYQAYPTFTTPDSLSPALARAGFDVLTTANNHCMDSNLEGAQRTLEILDQAGLEYTGTAVMGASSAPWRGTVGGFELSILAWTQSTNGIVSSRGMGSINVYSPRGADSRLNEMLEDIAREDSRNPDLLIVSVHWGGEYNTEPDDHQRRIADLILEAGADVIIGSHPHVLQPVEHRIVQRNDGPREAFIAWSMGNFLSSQRHGNAPREWVDGSALLTLELRRNESGGARVAAAVFDPVYVHWTDSHIRVLPVAEGLAETGEIHYPLSQYDRERLVAYDAWVPQQLTRYLGAIPAQKTETGWRVELP